LVVPPLNRTASSRLSVPNAMLSRVSTGCSNESPDGALPGKVVHLVRLDLAQRLDHAAEIVEAHRFDGDAIADAEPCQVRERLHLRIAGAAEYGVALVEQQAREIGAVLA
jgi:hypothetical protein